MQLSLLDVQTGADFPPHRRNSRTSIAAAHAVAPTLSGRRLLVLAAVARGKGTADDVALRLGLRVLSVRPRVTELSTAGLIAVTGEMGVTDMGKRAEVYRITSKGLGYLRQVHDGDVIHARQGVRKELAKSRQTSDQDSHSE